MCNEGTFASDKPRWEAVAVTLCGDKGLDELVGCVGGQGRALL